MIILVLAMSFVVNTAPAGSGSKEAEFKREIMEPLDENSDGVAEIKKYYMADDNGAKIIIRKELDLNADGKIDYIYYYANKTPRDEKVERIVVDNDLDGKFDEIRYYNPASGKLEKKELDLNFDGRPEVIKRYYNDQISKKEADTNFDGIIDYWEYYQDGKLSRTEVDTNNDGKPDKVGKTQIQEVYKFDIEDIERPKKKDSDEPIDVVKRSGKKALKAPASKSKKSKKTGKKAGKKTATVPATQQPAALMN